MSGVNNQTWGSYTGQYKHRVLPFDDFKNSRQYPLNVHETYTDWDPREAFRELWQNCIDAVIRTNHVDRKRLFATHEAVGEANGEATPPTGDTEIVFKVFSDGAPDRCLAFVRYKGQNGFGTVEITNFGASLGKKDLCIGGSSKKTLKDQAGAHGEGLKLAALVLMRSGQDHDVFCQTSGCKLFFRFNKAKDLVVDAHRIKEDQNPEVAQQPKNIIIRTPAVKAQGDVQFIIGQDREARDEDGEMGKRSPVSQKHFKDWIKVALLLLIKNGDESVISTASGKLLTSEDLRGNLYLKGLLLRESTKFRSASITGRPLGFGYDFAHGKTNRERESLANAYAQSVAIINILGWALLVRPDLVGRVCDLLNSAYPRYEEGEIKAGLWLVNGGDDKDAALMFKKVARMFKEYLLGGEFASRWLYSADEMDQNPSLLQIIEGMGRQPFKLTDNLWGILVQHGLVNTVEREALRWYEKAKAVSVPDHSFATSVSRLIQACARACPPTEAMRVEFVEFVDAGQLDLDLYVSKTEPLIRIHKRWLHSDSAVTELGLVGDMVEAETVAYTVKRLFADVLDYLPREKFLDQGSSRLPDSHMKRECHRAEQRLAKYQQIEVRIADKEDAGNPGLRLEWSVKSSRQDDEFMIEIHLHQVSTCSDLREKLHIAKDLETDETCIPQKFPLRPQRTPCVPRRTPHGPGRPTCIVHRTKAHQGTLYVPGLEAGEEYFSVLVTPMDPKSFVVVSSTKCVVPQPDIRPDASVSSSSPGPVVAQPIVHSNALASQAVRPAPPQNDAVQVPLHIRDGAEGPESISGSDSSVFSSGTAPSEPVTEALAPIRSHDAEGGSLVVPVASNQSRNNIAEESISRGPRLEPAAVRNLRLPRYYGWYWNSGDVPAVIGITIPEEEVSEQSRKRRRIG